MPEFVHLHVHSHYSLLDGLGKIPEILDRVQELGMNAVALTDHGAMHGIVEFTKEAQKRKMKPIFGVEAYLVPDRRKAREQVVGEKTIRHLTLLAETFAGYKNLLKLVTDAHLRGFYRKPCIDYDVLRAHHEGLIVLSGCMNGDLPQALIRGDRAEAERLIRWHLDVFGHDRYFFELQHHPTIREQRVANDALLALARQYGVGLVATGDAHYVRPEDAEAQDVLLCVQTGTKVTDKDRLSMLGEDFSLQAPDHFAEAFRDVPEALANTRRIAERCSVELTFGTNILPSYQVPAGETADTTLARLCEEGLATRYGQQIPQELRERLQYEPSVIAKTGFASYFLIVQDFVNWAKHQDIYVGPGRGSAAGSVVSYLVGITNIDPLKHHLVFERFLNPDRISMPDIDLDFADDRREEVLNYVRDRYGRDHVAQIITFGTMAARAAVRDVGRALGYPYVFCDKVAKLIPFGMSLAEAQRNARDLQKAAAEDPQVQRLLETARKLEGVARHASTHAAGVVITPSPLVEHVPLQRASADDATIVTQYDMHAVEDLGLLKIDFLGLKNLTILQHCLRIIAERHATTVALDALPLDDAATYRTLQDGLTTGVFQLESAGMKRSLKDLKPTEFEDIIAMVSLYRPGPMELIPQYIAGKHGLKTPVYLHPVLEPILRKTYGIAVYQEQVLQIARDLAGFTMGQADILRKAIGKKIPTLLKEQRDKFIAGATQHRVPKAVAEKVFDFIEPFAGYSFNRAHAACYALIAYQTAYLKTHYPAAFMASLLTSDENNTDRIAIEVTECTAMGISVLPPDVNESGEHFTVVALGPRETVLAKASDLNELSRVASGRGTRLRQGSGGQVGQGDARNELVPGPNALAPTPKHEAIRFGLLAVKNVGRGVVQAILEARGEGGAFTTIGDFFQRVQTKEFNKKAAESLAKAGAFDALGERNAILQNLEVLLNLHRAHQRQVAAGQGALFAGGADDAPRMSLRPAPPAPQEQRLRWEKELLGLYVSGHPMANVTHLLAGRTTPIKELTPDMTDYSVSIGGVVTAVQRVVTRSRDTMVFATLEDQTGSIEVLVFPRALEAQPDLWVEEEILIVEGRLNDRDGVPKVICENARRVVTAEKGLVAPPPATPEPVHITEDLPRPYVLLVIPQSGTKEILVALKQLLETLPQGPARVYLKVPTPKGTVDLVRTSYRITLDQEVGRRLAEVVGPHAVIGHWELAEQPSEARAV